MTNHPIIFSYLMHIKMLFHIQLCMVCVWVLVKGLCDTFTRHLEPHKSACLCALPRTVMLLCAVSNNPNDKVEIRVPLSATNFRSLVRLHNLSSAFFHSPHHRT